jgi:hypothetical protein
MKIKGRQEIQAQVPTLYYRNQWRYIKIQIPNLVLVPQQEWTTLLNFKIPLALGHINLNLTLIKPNS